MTAYLSIGGRSYDFWNLRVSENVNANAGIWCAISNGFIVAPKRQNPCKQLPRYGSFAGGTLDYAEETESASDDEKLIAAVLRRVANAHHRVVQEVLLRFAVQMNLAVIPRSARPEHIRQNLHCCTGWELSSDEFQALAPLRVLSYRVYLEEDPEMLP